MFGLQTVDNASSNSDTRKLHHIIQDSVKGYLWVTAADNLYVYKITADASLDKVDLSCLLSADRENSSQRFFRSIRKFMGDRLLSFFFHYFFSSQ